MRSDHFGAWRVSACLGGWALAGPIGATRGDIAESSIVAKAGVLLEAAEESEVLLVYGADNLYDLKRAIRWLLWNCRQIRDDPRNAGRW